MWESLREKINELIEEVGDATLVLVTKNQPKSLMKELLEIPEVRHIGENRWQEFKKKFLHGDEHTCSSSLYEEFKEKDIEFHFIGHLQTNKVDEVVKYFDVIQSVDSLRLLKKIDQEAKEIKKIQRVLLEINICDDPRKYGFAIEDLPEGVIYGSVYPNIHIEGFMTILKQGLSEKEQLSYFKKLKKFSETFDLPIISMGMSSDYKIALKAGSNMVRIGSKVFKEL